MKLSYGAKSPYGILADSCPPGLGCEFDIPPLINTVLAIDNADNPPVGSVSVVGVSCSNLPKYFDGHLRYVFGAGSKGTSLEMIIEGLSKPSESITKAKLSMAYQKTTNGSLIWVHHTLRRRNQYWDWL